LKALKKASIGARASFSGEDCCAVADDAPCRTYAAIISNARKRFFFVFSRLRGLN